MRFLAAWLNAFIIRAFFKWTTWFKGLLPWMWSMRLRMRCFIEPLFPQWFLALYLILSLNLLCNAAIMSIIHLYLAWRSFSGEWEIVLLKVYPAPEDRTRRTGITRFGANTNWDHWSLSASAHLVFSVPLSVAFTHSWPDPNIRQAGNGRTYRESFYFST